MSHSRTYHVETDADLQLVLQSKLLRSKLLEQLQIVGQFEPPRAPLKEMQRAPPAAGGHQENDEQKRATRAECVDECICAWLAVCSAEFCGGDVIMIGLKAELAEDAGEPFYTWIANTTTTAR